MCSSPQLQAICPDPASRQVLVADFTALFGTIAPYLPLTPALQGVRALASDGGGIGPAVGVLVGWLLLSFSVSVLAVARRRMLPAAVVTRRPVTA